MVSSGADNKMQPTTTTTSHSTGATSQALSLLSLQSLFFNHKAEYLVLTRAYEGIYVSLSLECPWNACSWFLSSDLY